MFTSHPYLDEPAERIIGSDHLGVIRLMIKNASSKGRFWKGLVRGMGFQNDRHTERAVYEACKIIGHAPMRHLCDHLGDYLFEEPSTRQATRGQHLRCLGDWRTYHHEILGRLTTQEEEVALEDLFAVGVHGIFASNKSGDRHRELQKRIAEIRGHLPIFAEPALLCPSTTLHPALAGPLRAWWQGVMKADALYLEKQVVSKSHEVTDDDIDQDDPVLHPDHQLVMEALKAIPVESTAWDDGAIDRLIQDISNLRHERQELRVSHEQQQGKRVGELLNELAACLHHDGDVDGAALATARTWSSTGGLAGHTGEAILRLEELLAGLRAVAEKRLLTEQMTGLTRRDRESRLAAFGQACDAIPSLVEQVARHWQTSSVAVVPQGLPEPVPEPPAITPVVEVVPDPPLGRDTPGSPETIVTEAVAPVIMPTAAAPAIAVAPPIGVVSVSEPVVISAAPLHENAGIELSGPVGVVAEAVSSHPTIDAVARQVWTLASWGELSLAGHLAEARARLMPEAPLLPGWLFHLALVGRHLRGHEGKGGIISLVHEACLSYAQLWRADGADTWNTGVRLLLAAGLLRSAVLAPETGAAGVLVDLHFIGDLREVICSDIADAGRRSVGLGMHAIRGAQSRAAWQEAIEAVQRQAQEWLESPRRRLLGPAIAVWDHWTKAGQDMPRLMEIVHSDDHKRLQEVLTISASWTDDRSFAQRLSETDRIMRPGTHRPTEARAKRQLESRRDETFAIIMAWATLSQQGKSLQENGHQAVEAERLRQRLRQHLPGARNEIADLVQHPDACVRAGAAALRGAIEDIGQLFDPDAKLTGVEIVADQVLASDLTRVPLLRLTEDGGIDTTQLPAGIVAAFEPLITGQVVPSRTEAIRQRLAHGDVRGAVLGIEQGRDDILPGQLAALEGEAERVRRDIVIQIKKQADALLVDLEDTAVLGTVLSEHEYQSFKAEVVRIIQRAERNETDNRAADSEILNRIRQQVDHSRAQQMAAVREQLESAQRNGQPLASDDPARLRVMRALEDDEVLAALEYLDQIRSGNFDDASHEIDAASSSFFPDRHQELFKFLIERPVEGKEVAARERILGLLTALEGSGADLAIARGAFVQRHPRAQELIDAWWIGRSDWRLHDRAEQIRHLRRLLLSIGFRLQADPRAESGGRHPLFTVDCTPIRDAQVIPVMTYGSLAEGHYRILCVGEKQLLPADLLAEIREQRIGSGSPPLIVMLFQAWSPSQRRELAHLCCQSPAQTVVVIDDVLVLHAVMQQRMILSEVMRCALPFTYLKPYSTTAGLVPPEVFFGRSREREAITAIESGSSLVYGGRQLGKTALLREIQREMHQPERMRIACYIELKALGIGISRPIEDLWPVIAHDLRQHGVVPHAGGNAIGPDQLLKHIYQYLSQSPEARVMLLLDEADRFLQADGAKRPEPFPVIDLLKQGMEHTKRRFKVVFAGLHAVQRSALSGNNPLVHLGEQICIGPLRGERDGRDARRLVTEPLASIGYRFESPDLVTRILSQANYYPSLIQLSCKILLERLLTVRARRQEGPPWVISVGDVDAAYRDGRLREAIAERFRWTLVLDNRYQIIALALALRDIESGGAGVYRDDDIQQEAFSWWEKGFKETRTTSAFRHLLMEMVGLGVLRDAGSGQYALRSLNVVPLLGTREQIEQQLVEAQQADPEPSFNPTVFRSPNISVDPRSRAPLTSHQLDVVRGHKRYGLIVLRGGAIADAPRVRRYLDESLKGTVQVVTLGSATTLTLLQRNLAEAIRGRDMKNGMIVIIESPSWTREWISETWSRLAGLSSPDAWVRVVFLLHPKAAWKHPELMQMRRDDVGTPDKSIDFHSICLTPWAADVVKDHLIEDRGMTSNGGNVVNDLMEVTNGWPGIFNQLHGRGNSDLADEALMLVTKAETDLTLARQLLDFFGVPESVRPALIQIAMSKPEPREWWPLLLQEASANLSTEEAARDAAALLNWLEEFDYARPGDRGVMVLDSTLQSALKALAKQPA